MQSFWNWLFSKTTTSASATRRMHVTFVKSRMGRSFSRTGVLLKKQLWIFPIIAIVLLAALGFGLRTAIERTMHDNLHSQLQTVLDLETAMLQNWFARQEAVTTADANDAQVRELVYELLDQSEPADQSAASVKNSIHARIKKEFGPKLSAHDFHSYMVIDKAGRIVSSDEESLIGRTDFAGLLDPLLKRLFHGEAVIVPPYPSKVLMKDDVGQVRTGIPVMLVLAPIRDASFQPVAALAYRIRAEQDFTRILRMAQMGATGETYAFDTQGRMVSNSRFDEELMQLGLLVDEPGSQSILQVQLRDPGGNLQEGYRPKVRRSELPLVKPVAEALEGRNGVDVYGYRDYRGVSSLGAWRFLPKYNIGVLTEIDRAEAYRPLSILRWTFFSLLALLAVAAVAIFFFSMVLSRMQTEARKSALETQKLGQYTLEDKLGSGGMGIVYKGRHAILRRPTAIKMLHLNQINDASVERFEREVQITCQLNNPHTVQIYDYGRTPEGLFYYAMEFLDGIDLQKLIEQDGPQSEARVIHILTQICSSLYEAHSLGLVHRDIKPANVMLNRRGGEPDVAKVLDFGLVKALDETKQSSLTHANSLTGTPLYMSPEAIQTPNAVDNRSDLYSLGALGYFLLTGQAVFEVQNLVDLCQKHVAELPIPPSQRLGQPVSAELESALLKCLEKSRAKRPQTARDLAGMLARAPTAATWSIDDADLWWSRFERGQSPPAAPANSNGSRTTATDPGNQTFIVNS